MKKSCMNSTFIGHKYKRHASIVLPLFRRGKIVNNFDMILDCTDQLLNQWRTTTEQNFDHIHLNIVDQCQNLSLAIFGFLGFNYDLQTLEESNINSKNKLTQALGDFVEIFIQTTRLPNFLSEVYLKFSPRYQRARVTIEQYLNQIIEQEQSKTPEEIAAQKRTSLIASMVTSLQQDEKAEAAKPEQDRKGTFLIPYQQLVFMMFFCCSGLSRAEVIHELLLFLVAGAETSGTVLAWFIYFASKHPRVQTKLKAELGDNKHNRLAVEQMESLTYLDCVLEEVFRFLPPAACTTRAVIVDDQLPGSGVTLHKGDEILIPFHCLARDQRCWKVDPDLFYPERFQGEDKDHHAYGSIPFGGGHRQCIGQDLARFELKTIIARLMQQVTFGDGGEQVNAGGYVQKLTTVPKNVGVTIIFD